MRLKKLEIYGFKSFAERTVVVFDEGITGIVGPNGSGKSNLSDAVRWVLGEQSAKALRGGKMEDVIFGGTQKRKRMGYCEVSLVFDNEDHALPVDYTEVMVTRRVYRTGEGEYYINKSACRLKDIVELFRDTGIGIPEEERAKIFDRFYKVDTFTQGTGLGLPICKNIAEQLGGRIGVDSAVGAGSCFWVEIPAGE